MGLIEPMLYCTLQPILLEAMLFFAFFATHIPYFTHFTYFPTPLMWCLSGWSEHLFTQLLFPTANSAQLCKQLSKNFPIAKTMWIYNRVISTSDNQQQRNL